MDMTLLVLGAVGLLLVGILVWRRLGGTVEEPVTDPWPIPDPEPTPLPWEPARKYASVDAMLADFTANKFQFAVNVDGKNVMPGSAPVMEWHTQDDGSVSLDPILGVKKAAPKAPKAPKAAKKPRKVAAKKV